MIDPLLHERRSIERGLDARVRRVGVGELDSIEAAVREHGGDVAMIATSWRETPQRTQALFERLHALEHRPRLIYLDTFDSTSSPFFGILPFVDAYVKKQVLRDRSLYRRELTGGYIFADHLVAERGWDLDGWHFGSTIAPEHLARLRVGWNLGTALHLRRQLARPRALRRPLERRPIDVFCRVALRSMDGRDWYSRYRLEALQRVQRLERHCTVVAGGGLPGSADLVRPRHYRREMRRSRIVVSPFGWGELCYRDFEAVCAGCLLLKPSVEHLDTRPDIYQPGETYVPLRWDLADLEETCLHWLQRPAEMQRLVDAAHRAYARWFRERCIVDAVREVVAGPAGTVPRERPTRAGK